MVLYMYKLFKKWCNKWLFEYKIHLILFKFMCFSLLLECSLLLEVHFVDEVNSTQQVKSE